MSFGNLAIHWARNGNWLTHSGIKVMWQRKSLISATKTRWRVILAAMPYQEMQIEFA
jgi:hypothetical protein